MSYQERIKSWMSANGLTRHQAALKLGISAETLRNYEYGRRKPQSAASRAWIDSIINPNPKSPTSTGDGGK